MNDDNEFPSPVHLQPISSEIHERRYGEKQLIVVNPRMNKEDTEAQGSPWLAIVENVQKDLISSFEVVRKEMESQELHNMKPNLIAKFGKIFFHRTPKISLGAVGNSPVSETTLRKLKRTFYSSVPGSYMENVLNDVVPKIGLGFVEHKDTYRVKLSDSKQPGVTISCKCTLDEDKKLKLNKVYSNPVGCIVMDIFCLDKDLDLRLDLHTKKTLTSSLTDDEMIGFRNLLNSGVVDEDVKGGIRWPLGKALSGERYEVVAVYHTVTKAYTSDSLRLKVRNADRFDFMDSSGRSSKEIVLVMKGLVSKLQEEKIDDNSVSDMLKDTIKLIWENFLSCEEPFFT
jgi:hypothetical protein